MLFFLTGDIQTGKTRWLMRQIDALEQAGVTCCGVVAPGTWIQREDGFEKTGIDNLLLPEKQLVPFARRRDLAERAESFNPTSQAARAQLGWAIDDAAIQQVNDHFRSLAALESPGSRLLVVDELGRLELERENGLTEAVALLERGATNAFPHALVIVRASLLPAARSRFAAAPWNGMRRLSPTDEDAHTLIHIASEDACGSSAQRRRRLHPAPAAP